MSIVVRRATLADRPAIDRFIVAAYDELAPYKDPARWSWQFEHNPYLGAANGEAPVWIALDGADVVGQIAVQGADFILGGKSRPGGWIVDVMIAESHRGLGLGHKLYQAASRDVGLLVTLTMALATRKMGERLDAIDLTTTHHFTLWRNVGGRDVRRYLKQRIGHKASLYRLADFACRFLLAGEIAALGTRIVAALRGRSGPARSPEALRMVEVETFGPEVDGLWDRIAPHYGALSRRDSRFLNWRFVDAPRMRYRRFLAYRGDELVAYSILRRTEDEELRQGVIVDMLAAPAETGVFAALVSHAIGQFGRQVATVDCGASVPEIQGLLKAFGFIPVRTHRPTAVVAGAALRAEVEATRHQWLFSKADHDWDQVHLG